MILLDGSPFFEVKRRLAINQYWKAAALIRDVI